MAHVADVVSVLYRTNDDIKMRVPLACFIKYRNYKCLCTCYEFDDNNENNQIVYHIENGITKRTNPIIT